MSLTKLDALIERKHAYEKQVQKHYQEIAETQNSLDTAAALILQIEMLEMAEGDPRIKAFSFDANFEYDDEGSYFWCASIRAEGELSEIEVEDYEQFCELEHIAGQEATQLAFGSETSFEGRITVAKLRDELL
jgi:hypothetical protein